MSPISRFMRMGSRPAKHTTRSAEAHAAEGQQVQAHSDGQTRPYILQGPQGLSSFPGRP